MKTTTIAITAAAAVFLVGVAALLEFIPAWEHIASAIGSYVLARFLVKQGTGINLDHAIHATIRSKVAPIAELVTDNLAAVLQDPGAKPTTKVTDPQSVELPSVSNPAGPTGESGDAVDLCKEAWWPQHSAKGWGHPDAVSDSGTGAGGSVRLVSGVPEEPGDRADDPGLDNPSPTPDNGVTL